MQSHRFFLVFCFAFVSWYPTAAQAVQVEDWRSTGDEWIFRLTEPSNFQEGCFEPCLCPLQTQVGLHGVMALRRLGVVNGIAAFHQWMGAQIRLLLDGHLHRYVTLAMLGTVLLLGFLWQWGS